MSNYILIGAAGYVAPRHMEAIKSVGGNLVAAIDPHDSVGILDRYFPECTFFTEFERLDRHIHKLLSHGTRIDYVSICSPNYLHDAHCRWAMRIGADAICEKPLVLNERNLDELLWMEETTGQKVWNILQLRVHPSVQGACFIEPRNGDTHEILVDYVTPRGKWYDASWKSDISKSGGLATNIGVHLFDLTSHLYGKHLYVDVVEKTQHRVSGLTRFQSAEVLWTLSIEKNMEPRRVFNINGMEFDLSSGFSDLHNMVYERTLDGEGFGIEDARESIRICEAIRNA